MTDETIVALSSAPGPSHRAIVRLSGPRAREIAEAVGEGVDRLLFPAGRSYTREETVEFQLPGAPPLVEALMEVLIDRGARAARPGEFTLRAWLNGRLGLAEAEAVVDLIDAENGAESRAALERSAFSRELQRLESETADLFAEVEANVDFVGEDEVPLLESKTIRFRAEAVRKDLDGLLARTSSSRAGMEKPVAVLFGPPNSGKSSLFNRLCDAGAIESDFPGTTRDVLRGNLGDADLLDTAGWMEGREGADAEAVRRTETMLERADLVVLVVDAGDPEPARRLLERVSKYPLLTVLNKTDLEAADPGLPVRDLCPASAATGEGLEELREHLLSRLLSGPRAVPGARFHANVRQMGQLRRARAALVRAAEGAQECELAAVDLREALESLGSLTGSAVTESILDRIFSRFCLGK